MSRDSIPSEIVRRIQDASDIVDVVSGYLTLQKKGQNYVGLCPFHHEKTPSFVVSPAKQLFHCFGCGAGGDVIGFLMKADSLSFPEAVRTLGEKAGIPIPTLSFAHKASSEDSIREPLLKIHQEAAEYYHQVLANHPAAQNARRYLEERGVRPETVQTFTLGYALPAWDGLLKHLQRQGWSFDQVERAGLAISREERTGQYDRFRDRIIFPIRNLQGKVIAFGGRLLPGRQFPSGNPSVSDGPSLPKYLNSPETPIYTKGQHLFAIERARGAASRAGSLVIVEGYLDALAAHQAGVENTVATLGTALTSEHLHLIRRFTRKVILVFDPDLAGVRATLRTVELFLGSGMAAQVVTLPEGLDPDSFIKSHGAQAFQELLSKPVGLLEYTLQQMVTKTSHKTLEEKLKIINEVLPVLAGVPNHVERSHYVKWVADELQVHERDLGEELTRHHKQSRKGQKQTQISVSINPQFPPEEEQIIRLLLQGRVSLGELKNRLRKEDFTDARLGRVFALLLETSRPQGEVQVREILQAVQGDSQLNQTVSAWTLQELVCEDYEKTAQDCIQAIRSKYLARELRGMEERIRRAEQEADREAIRALQEEVLALKKEMLLAQQGRTLES